ncbi:acetyltransferase (GNAT) family protein [Mucilaginibacter yixingensis]|uniref:Acetyltransferase (GNAT) family protein n=1 Tax=Mucilaginibacter yixingensis TaxID=1295612 RepID=A0A2T5J4Z5_9SPHI|nr:GNAT family N-acetyltransferase [Mucilaginibacter yixingensis]PTQ92641.1 acetyltransferase (GNAT) family protein [Mucilaginibacter yixingensis]
MITQFTIRDAREADIPELSLLLTQLGYPCTPEEVKVRFDAWANHPDHRTLVICDGDRLAGMTGLMKSLWVEKNGTYVRILAFVIHEDYRGQKIGKQLLQAVDTWAHEIGANTIVVNSGNREERIPAHHFYQNNGYKSYALGFVKSL